ncbi:MAG: hypothetical protein MI806_25950 [Minwuiales bacterium]|nr:hypothetical protein [Minwuiales bacterium]
MSDLDHDKTGLNFTQFVESIDGGQLRADLDDALRDAVASMKEVHSHAGGKPKAKIAVTFDLKLDGGVIEVTPDMKVTTPKRPIDKAVFWATGENKLSRANPDQLNMNFNDANRPPRAIN